MFLLFINNVKARRIVDASCLCLHVAAAASGRFQPGKNIGDTSLYLWASIPLGGTGAHSDRVPLSLAAEAMFWGDSVVVLLYPYVGIRTNSLIFGDAIFLTSTSKTREITTSTLLRQLILQYEDSVRDPPTLLSLES